MPCPADPRTARREVLWTLGGFVLLALAFVVVMDVRFPYWTDREYAARRQIVLERQAEFPERPLLVVLGSSRVGVGFVPEDLGPIYDAEGRQVSVINFSHLGAGPRMNLLQLRRLLRDGVVPKYLIVELLPVHLHHEPMVLSELAVADTGVLLRYWENQELIAKAAEYRLTAVSRYRANCLQSIAPAFASGERVLLNPNGGDCNWERPANLDAGRREGLTRLVHEQCADSMANWHVNRLLDGAMRELLQLCLNHDIRVAIVLFPETSAFRSWYGEGVEDRIEEYYLGLFFDYHISIFDDRWAMADESFIDPHHLSLSGAKVFTAKLRKTAIQELVTPKRPGETRVAFADDDIAQVNAPSRLRLDSPRQNR